MQFEYTYMFVAGLLILVGAFYVSPYELSVNEDDDEE